MAQPAERTILIAMDGSEHSDYAFKFYMENIHKPTDHVILLHCPEYHTIVQSLFCIPPWAIDNKEGSTVLVDTMVMADVSVVTELLQEEEKRIKEFLEKLGQKLKDAGIGGKVKSVGGNPGEVIVKEADECGATMIVTGTRGMGAVRRTLLGSISDYIMHHSHIPVVVCRHKDSHKEHKH